MSEAIYRERMLNISLLDDVYDPLFHKMQIKRRGLGIPGLPIIAIRDNCKGTARSVFVELYNLLILLIT